MRGQLGIGLLLLLNLAPLAAGQALAPPQPREARFRPPAARVGPGPPASEPDQGMVSPLGIPLPTPLGLGSPSTDVYAGRVFAPGMNVQIPMSAAGSGARMFAYPNADGGQTTILYNPSTGAVVEYNQTMNVGRLGQGPRYGQPTAAYFNPGAGTQDGIFGGPTNVTMNPATGAFRGIDPGIPQINAMSPSYDYKANAPQTFSTPAPIFGSSAGAGVSNPINVSSPSP